MTTNDHVGDATATAVARRADWHPPREEEIAARVIGEAECGCRRIEHGLRDLLIHKVGAAIRSERTLGQHRGWGDMAPTVDLLNTLAREHGLEESGPHFPTPAEVHALARRVTDTLLSETAAAEKALRARRPVLSRRDADDVQHARALLEQGQAFYPLTLKRLVSIIESLTRTEEQTQPNPTEGNP